MGRAGRFLRSAMTNGTRASTLDRKSTRLNSSHSQISYAVFCLIRHPPLSTLFPYTTLFRSAKELGGIGVTGSNQSNEDLERLVDETVKRWGRIDALINSAGHGPRGPLLEISDDEWHAGLDVRSEEHTSELQSQSNLVCRLLLDTPPTALYTLSLHDALPICQGTWWHWCDRL